MRRRWSGALVSGLVMAAVGVAAAGLTALPGGSAAASTVPDGYPTRPALWVDRGDHTYVAWAESDGNNVSRRLIVARTLADSDALDGGFGVGGRQVTALVQPWTDGSTGAGYGRIDSVEFTSAGTLTAVWDGPCAPEFCVGLMALDTYSVSGARLSRHTSELPVDGSAGCVGECRFAALDNGTVILATCGDLARVSGWNAATGAALGTVNLRAGSMPDAETASSLGSSGAVVNDGTTFDPSCNRPTVVPVGPTSLISSWSAPTTVPNQPRCTWSGAPNGLLHLCAWDGQGSPSVVTLTNPVGTTVWQRSFTFGPVYAPIRGTVTGDGRAVFMNGAIMSLTAAGPVQRVDLNPTTYGGNEGTALPRRLSTGKLAGAATAGTDSAGNGTMVITVGQGTTTTPPPEPTVPGKPAVPVAVPRHRSVQLSWSAPSDGGSPITGYRITPYKDGVAQAPIVVGNMTSYLVTGLTDGVSYRFTVAAINAIGSGPPSDPSTAVAPATVPGAPTNVKAVPGNHQATVTWTKPASDGGSPITGYKVRVIANGSPLLDLTEGNVTSAVVTSLAPGTIYTFEVAAVNAVGTGPYSATSNPVTPPPAGFATWAAMAARQFADLIGRAPSAAELNTWVPPLTAGSKPAGALPAALRTSVDNTTNVDPVTRLYTAYFLRTPEPGGLRYWVGRRRTGTSLFTVSNAFAGSAEFTHRYGSLTNKAFVQLVYKNVLNRPGEPNGVAYWTAQLDQHRRTRGEVMVGFSESHEYISKKTHDVDVVVLYIFMLGRAPTAAELSTTVHDLTNGETITQLAQHILDSDEYATRLGGHR
ncbi:MAG: cell wall-binding protein [Acidimicrobiales bacterium]|nr:cell wall-binding protein [Acidimicrobiales bacterium]